MFFSKNRSDVSKSFDFDRTRKLGIEALEVRALLTATTGEETLVTESLDVDDCQLSSVSYSLGADDDVGLEALMQEVDDIELSETSDQDVLDADDFVENPSNALAFTSFENDLDDSFDLIDISTGLVRHVVFYSNSDASNYDFSDSSKIFIECDEPNTSAMGENGLMNSGGGDPVSVGALTVSSGSTGLLEADGYSASGGAATSYFVLQVPEVPFGYMGFLEFTGTAKIGTDFSITEGVTPSTTLRYFEPGANGVTRIGVSGGSTVCVFPLVDNIVEPTETIDVSFGIIQSSGGASIVGDAVNATIIDAGGAPYEYKLREEGGMSWGNRYPWISDRPEEYNQSTEWSALDFGLFYCRSNATPCGDSPNSANSVDLVEAGLLDDYRREMFNGSNLNNWRCFEDSLFAGISLGLLNGDRSFGVTGGQVARNFSSNIDLLVYGHGNTLVQSDVTGYLISHSEISDNIGVSTITDTYVFSVQYFCSIRDKFEEPLDWSLEGGLDCDWEVGTPYWLTGSWSETATYQVSFTYDRVENSN